MEGTFFQGLTGTSGSEKTQWGDVVKPVVQGCRGEMEEKSKTREVVGVYKSCVQILTDAGIPLARLRSKTRKFV